MQLTSSSFADGGPIPERCAMGVPHAEDPATFGPNRNPHLAWSEVPEGTRSFVLTCVDAHAPTRPDDVNQADREVPADLPRGDFVHWVVVDLPAELREIDEGSFAEGIVAGGKAAAAGPHGCRQGVNDYTSWFAGHEEMGGTYRGYDGPFPPWNDSLVHHYTFTLYALDVPETDVAGDFTIDDVQRAIDGHVLAEASTAGTYTLNRRLRA